MSVTSVVGLNIQSTGDVVGIQNIATTSNSSGSGKTDIVTLASGANTITVPTSGTTPKGVIIVPPSGNSQSIILKGVTGDTGVRLHNTEPSYVSLDSSVTTFVLTAGGTVTGLRLFWN